jgi:hypothetical protein
MYSFSKRENMTVLDAMEEIEDRRRERCKKHELVDILMIYLVGFFVGLTDIESIVFWSKKIDYLHV